jgi:hypothetical protein
VTLARAHGSRTHRRGSSPRPPVLKTVQATGLRTSTPFSTAVPHYYPTQRPGTLSQGRRVFHGHGPTTSERLVRGSAAAGWPTLQVYGRTETEVRQKLAELERKLAIDQAPPPGKLTVRELCERWLETERKRWKPRTLHDYQRLLERFVYPAIGSVAGEAHPRPPAAAVRWHPWPSGQPDLPGTAPLLQCGYPLGVPGCEPL